MINETFVASSPKEAYEQAVQKYGSNISLLVAKQIMYDDGVLRCEVVISVPEDVFSEKTFGEDFSIDEVAKDEKLLLEIVELKEELALMKEGKQSKTIEDKQVPTQVKELFVRKGISALWLDSIFSSLTDTELLEDAALLASYLLGEIDCALQIKDENLSVPKVMMFVGPTGVGKTTTIAKLAARYAYLLDKAYKVAFINLDSYKVGATEQLAQYAEIMQVEHISLADVNMFKEALDRLSDHDIILVDTAGMSPYDTEKFIKTVEYMKADSPIDLEVNLVISATVKYEDMEDIYQNFSFLNLNSLIISKFDETKHFGVLLNFMLLYRLPMAYFSIGQDVPNDLMMADKEYLLERFIGDIDEG